jgi:hypothetical protein
VTIEFARDFRRRRHVAGTVVRFVGAQIVVSCTMRDGGAKDLHSFDRRGIRIGSGQYPELVNAEVPTPAAATDQRRQAARVDAAYRNGYGTEATSSGCGYSARRSTPASTCVRRCRNLSGTKRSARASL